MRVVNREIITDYIDSHVVLGPPIGAWMAEVGDAHWKSPAEMKQLFPNASILSGNRVVFNIKGNAYRLDTKIHYPSETIFIKRIGTHAEYSKWKF